MRGQTPSWPTRPVLHSLIVHLTEAKEAADNPSGGGRGSGGGGGGVEEGGANGPSWWELAGRVAAHVRLHGGQAGAAGFAQRAAVGCGPVRPQVLGHG